MNSINMSGFGYSMFSDKVKLRVGNKTISIGASNQNSNQNKFGIGQIRQAQQTGSNNNKLSSIMLKFNAGKKLSAEEMAYLRQHSPENYKKVQQVMMEREMLERQMEQAKTKEQSNTVYMTAVSASMPKGTGGEGGGGSMDVAKLNQFADAHRIYTASSHYKAKTDQSDITEEERLKQEEMAGKMEEQHAKLEESMEKQEAMKEEMALLQEENAVNKEESRMEEAKDVLDEVERLKKVSKRKRKKIHARRKRNGTGTSATFHFSPLSEAQMREKLRELYATKNETVGITKTSKKNSNAGSMDTSFVGTTSVGNSIDISL